MTERGFRKIAIAALAATVAVILWGAFVRATGSGAGCGSHWPMCNGEVIPRAKSLATIIEYTHRLTSGVVLVAVVVELVWALRCYPRGHRVRAGAWASVGFMVSEALVGAGLVLFELVAHDASVGRAISVAVHLTNTFLLVGAMTLTLWWSYGGAPIRLRRQGAIGVALAIGAVAVIVVGVSGAVAALGDTLFPSATFAEGLTQDLAPTAHLFIRLRLLHPVLAALTAGYLFLASGAIAARRPSASVRRAAGAVAGIVLAQVAAGLANLAMAAPVWMQLVHLLIADALWIALVLLAAASLSSEAAARSPAENEAASTAS